MSMTRRMSEEPILDQLQLWMDAQEDEHFEYKEARNNYSREKLAQYCCALANEGGGRMILGVTDKHPRAVVGTSAFMQPETVRSFLMSNLHLRIGIVIINHPHGRVLVFEIPPRPVGVAIKFDGIYWSREGDSLVPMADDKLRLVFAEAGHDFSADVCPGVGIEHLDLSAVEDFRRRWIRKSRNVGLEQLPATQLLRDAEMMEDGGITYAALALFGTHSALGRFLGQAEVVFEYRPSESAGPAQDRKDYRVGFFSFYDDLWNTINLRNDIQHYQDGLFVLDIRTFDERSVREAVLNAISHRDYQLGGSIFVRQYGRRLVVESPGGFPVGVTLDNVLDRQAPRNRRIADALSKCGLVERSGQGMNLMFEQSISQGKLPPDFSGTDAYQVRITLHGLVQDPRFVQFLEKVGQEITVSFDTHDLVLLDLVHHEVPVPSTLHTRLRRLIDLGVVESVGRGKGARYLLARRFYTMIGKKGAYTRRRGLDDGTHHELLLRHLRDNPDGSPLSDLIQVLPQLGPRRVQRLLARLRKEGLVRLEGERRWARWFSAKDKGRLNGL